MPSGSHKISGIIGEDVGVIGGMYAIAVRWLHDIFELEINMTRNLTVLLYIVLLISSVVGVDLLFFKDRFWERLAVNIGIVLIFTAFYFRFLKNP